MRKDEPSFVINEFPSPSRAGRMNLSSADTEMRHLCKLRDSTKLAEVGQTASRKQSGLPAGSGATAVDTAASCTLRPKSVRNRGKCADRRPVELAAVDATAATLSNGNSQSV